jgi:hypothetical protein
MGWREWWYHDGRKHQLLCVHPQRTSEWLAALTRVSAVDRLDAGISKRPSRFDRKYHFALPATPERIQYCEYWRLVPNTSGRHCLLCWYVSIDQSCQRTHLLDCPSRYPLRLPASPRVSASHIFKKPRHRLAVDRSNAESESGQIRCFKNFYIWWSRFECGWQAISKQVQTLRKEMKDSRKSVEDAEKNSMLSDARSSSATDRLWTSKVAFWSLIHYSCEELHLSCMISSLVHSGREWFALINPLHPCMITILGQ